MYGFCYPAASDRKHRVARLVGALINLKLLAAPLEHFRHKLHPVKLPFAVESAQDMFLALHLDPVSHLQFAAALLHILTLLVFRFFGYLRAIRRKTIGRPLRFWRYLVLP